MVAVSVRQNLKVSQALAPLLGSLCAAGSAGAAGALGAEERPASLRGVSSMPWAWSFSRARARSSEVAFKARRAEPSAAAGA